MSNTFCVTITHCKTDGDKATLGFVVANAAQGSEKQTMVLLSSDGVYCAVPEELAKINEGGPFAPGLRIGTHLPDPRKHAESAGPRHPGDAQP